MRTSLNTARWQASLSLRGRRPFFVSPADDSRVETRLSSSSWSNRSHVIRCSRVAVPCPPWQLLPVLRICRSVAARAPISLRYRANDLQRSSAIRAARRRLDHVRAMSAAGRSSHNQLPMIRRPCLRQVATSPSGRHPDMPWRASAGGLSVSPPFSTRKQTAF